jgi:transcriptional regulator with PAS, ATPase and Fis domain
VEEFNRKFKKNVQGFTEDTERILLAYSWPGNVRELKNIIERIMILHDDGTLITSESLPAEMKASIQQKELGIRTENIPLQPSSERMDFNQITERITNESKRKIIENALEITRGNKTEAARRLGISRYKLIREKRKIDNHIL